MRRRAGVEAGTLTTTIARPSIAAAAILVALTSPAACGPDLADRPWLITQRQIVGWKADPPEAAPGTAIGLQVVALDPDGPVDTASTSWALCHAPKPLAENRVVSPACLTPSSVDAVGDPVQVTLPVDACVVFGPDTPQPASGAPPTRPRDPDPTGGYYQPVTIGLGTSLAVGLARVTCDLPGASLAAARAFQLAYHVNLNPKLADLAISSLDGAPIVPADAASAGPSSALAAPAVVVPGGTQIQIEATWLPGSAETFALFDRTSQEVVERQETLGVSWFVTGGHLATAPPATPADPTTLSARATWQAPVGPGAFELVVVLRDSRGGTDAARAHFVVEAGGS